MPYARLQFVSESVQGGGGAKDISLRYNNEHHPALLGRFVIVAPSINVQTLTYLPLGRRGRHGPLTPVESSAVVPIVCCTLELDHEAGLLV